MEKVEFGFEEFESSFESQFTLIRSQIKEKKNQRKKSEEFFNFDEFTAEITN